MRANEIISEDVSRRGFLRGLGGAALAGAGISAAKDSEAGTLPQQLQFALLNAIGEFFAAQEAGLISPAQQKQLSARAEALLSANNVNTSSPSSAQLIQSGYSRASRMNPRAKQMNLDNAIKLLNDCEQNVRAPRDNTSQNDKQLQRNTYELSFVMGQLFALSEYFQKNGDQANAKLYGGAVDPKIVGMFKNQFNEGATDMARDIANERNPSRMSGIMENNIKFIVDRYNRLITQRQKLAS